MRAFDWGGSFRSLTLPHMLLSLLQYIVMVWWLLPMQRTSIMIEPNTLASNIISFKTSYVGGSGPKAHFQESHGYRISPN